MVFVVYSVLISKFGGIEAITVLRPLVKSHFLGDFADILLENSVYVCPVPADLTLALRLRASVTDNFHGYYRHRLENFNPQLNDFFEGPGIVSSTVVLYV
jgi:hypothetical protein